MAFSRDTGLVAVSPSGDPVAKQARTVNGDSGWLDIGDARALIAQLQSDAGTGTTPTLDVKVRTSYDGTDATAIDVPTGAFTQVGAAASNQILNLATFHRFVKVMWTIGGTATPTFNFGVYLGARR